MLWSGPFQILVVLGLLVRVIHVWPAVAGLAVTVALIPMTTLVGRKLGTVRKRLMGYTDARVKLCTEVVTGERGVGEVELEGRVAWFLEKGVIQLQRHYYFTLR